MDFTLPSKYSFTLNMVITPYLSKLLIEPGVDITRFIHPLLLTLVIGDQQAGHFNGAAAIQKILTMRWVMLCVSQFDIQPQPGHLFANFDAERAGPELVKRQVFGGFINRRLLLRRAADGLG